MKGQDVNCAKLQYASNFPISTSLKSPKLMTFVICSKKNLEILEAYMLSINPNNSKYDYILESKGNFMMKLFFSLKTANLFKIETFGRNIWVLTKLSSEGVSCP